MTRIAAQTKENLDGLRLESSSWGEQFHNAMNVNGGDVENATTFDYIMHFLSFFWKVSLRLKIKRSDWLLADTCPQAAKSLRFIWSELKFYNLEASFCVLLKHLITHLVSLVLQAKSSFSSIQMSSFLLKIGNNNFVCTHLYFIFIHFC